MCKRFPGFLRVAIADPQPERRWFRRGWVSFERQVNIKEICWSLNNIRVSLFVCAVIIKKKFKSIFKPFSVFLIQLRDCELGAIVNRDLSRRIRSVNGLTSHKQIVRHDIKLSAKIVHNLDNRVGLWKEEKKDESALKQEEEKENKNAPSNNEVEQAVSKICISYLDESVCGLRNVVRYLIKFSV